MVLLAGLFQVLTLILDQIVIQKQDENRRMTFERSSSLEKRNLLLKDYLTKQDSWRIYLEMSI